MKALAFDMSAENRVTPAELARQALSEIPAVIKIGPFDYEVVRWTAFDVGGSGKFGESGALSQKIALGEAPSPHRLADTLLHEIGHAILRVFGVDANEQIAEERFVSYAATGLTMVLRDNPWLASWLAKWVK